MRILCAYSGIQFNCEHFPGYLSSREVCHPIFYLKQHKLLSHATYWASGKMTDTDAYLFYLALLNSTGQIEWRVPAIKTHKTSKIISLNMDALIRVVGKINLVKHPGFVIPTIAITSDTKDLVNSHHWIANWEQAFQEFSDGYKSVSWNKELQNREIALEKLIKSQHRSIQSYASILADWAAMAGSFPEFNIVINKETVTLAEYWKSIIRKAAQADSLLSVDEKDLKELYEHCEIEIPVGTIHRHVLMKFLREAIQAHSNFYCEDLKLDSGSFRIIDDPESTEAINLKNLIESAPTKEPNRKDYPTHLLYLKDKLKWQLAQNKSKEV